MGILGAVLMAAIGYLNRYLGALTHLTRGHFPITVFGGLFVVMAAINPALGAIRRRWSFRPAELAVMIALTLVGCNLADAGLMRHFTQGVALPVADYQTKPHWKKAQLIEYVPPAMFLAGGDPDDPALLKLTAGSKGDPAGFGLGDIPWPEWIKLMAFWGPMILLFATASISLAVIVHRNWCARERLRYPIASFATMLLRQDPERGSASIFRNRLFWLGFAVLVGVRVINGLHEWYPREMIEIPLRFDFLSAFNKAFPVFMKTPQASYLARPIIFPTAIALAFLVAKDISFSMGISNLASAVTFYFMIRAGVRMSSSASVGGANEWLTFGAFVGFAMMVIYIGRRHYWLTFRRALAFIGHRESEIPSVRAARAFLLSMLGMIAMLALVGLSWPVAAGLIFAVVLMHFVMARMSAECGVFFFMPAWTVLGVLIGAFGADKLGPGPIVIVGVFVAAMGPGPWECLMPYITNGLKMTEDSSVRSGRVATVAIVAFALALAVVLMVGLWCGYYYGQGDSMVVAAWNEASRSVNRLNTLGTLEQVNATSGWAHLAAMRPESDFIWAAGVGLLLVLACSTLRLRFTWWPLHPVIFLVFGAWSMAKYCPSFLIGWALKTGVSHFGGSRAYRQAVILMAGVIAGDVLGGSIFMVANVIYYMATGVRGLEYVKSYIL